jgi:fermentation-respiration switch protein FrsA (DUF1100 family)
MIEMFEEQVEGIHVIHAAPAGRRAQPLPTVFFYHGFTSSKEVYSYFAYALASAGFRVIAPDANMHGERYDGDEQRRLDHFWEILRQNIDELAGLKQVYEQRGLIEEGRIGVCGASMGGMTTLGALTCYEWIASAAAFMGSGYFGSLSHTLFPPLQQGRALTTEEHQLRIAPLLEYDISEQLPRVADRPLLVWHGEADDVVPLAESERLRRDLQEKGLDKNLTYLTEAHIGHKITPPALQACVAFFRHHL